ncbi:MAG: Fic/DOC family protein [Micromonosporaceae bacterium]
MTGDPYVDPATGLLANKLGITDTETLNQAIADITAARLDQLATRHLPGSYDLNHLKAFHRAIFSDIFEWAGQTRTVQIAKQTGFCLPQHIETYAASEFAKLAKDNYLRQLAWPDFVDKLAYYQAEINELHPFREGNGRTQRAFLYQLAREAGYHLDWTRVDADDNIEAAIAAHNGDLEPMRRLLRTITNR